MNLRGCMTALITPFRDGAVDVEALEQLVESQIAAGISALVPCGSTGEAATLTHSEHAEVVRLVVNFTKKRVPVIAGTGSNSTAEAIALTEAAKEAGADAALLIAPYYNKPTQEGIYQHYRAIARATGFPLILYNIPGRTACKIEAATIARLCELKEVVGLKDSTGSLDEIQEVVRLCGDRLAVLSGDDSLTLPILAVGGVGVISVASNLVPDRCVAMVASALAGDWPTARAQHYALLPLYRALFLETNPIPIKAALSMIGVCREELRLPLVPMSPSPREQLRSVLRQYGFTV
ncbi:MAG: 4-hydroxy-tetrahydrodipicolinate synthase [Candidatus Binatia bacterium]|nr:MAG: 4-hydroxy-tetrahydrodipicolinate synthase [Candidatus Binatia bacterium]